MKSLSLSLNHLCNKGMGYAEKKWTHECPSAKKEWAHEGHEWRKKKDT